MQRLAPTGLVGGELKHATVTRVTGEERHPERDRIFARCNGEFVDECLGRVRGVRRTHRAPPQHGHADFGRMQVDGQVRDRIGQRRRAFDRRSVDAVLDEERFERCPGQDRLPYDPMLPADDIAAGVEPRFECVIVSRPIVAGLHVVFARPDELDRCRAFDRHGQVRRFAYIVVRRIGASSEAAAGEQLIDLHLLRLESDDFSDRHLVHGLKLFAVPDFATAGVEFDDAVQRFHRRVRKIGKLE